MQMSPLKKANEVLKFLATSPFAKPFISLTEIINRIETVSFKENNAIELVEILDKLERDKYIISEIRKIRSSVWDEGAQDALSSFETIKYFRVTLEGRMFEG